MGTQLRKLSFNEGWPRHLREIFIVLGGYFVYMFTRRFILGDIEAIAFANALKVIDFESTLGLLWEPRWQDWALHGGKWVVVFFNWAYILTFSPVILITAIIVYRKSWKTYHYYRNVVLLSYVVALILFLIFPLAPPRMVPQYFVDTINAFGPTGYGNREMAVFYNAYAAMPSLHFAWTVLFGVLFFRTGRYWLKVAGVLYPTLTLLAITITGNHYVVDAIAGGLVIVASFALYEAIDRWGASGVVVLRTTLPQRVRGLARRAKRIAPPKGVQAFRRPRRPERNL